MNGVESKNEGYVSCVLISRGVRGSAEERVKGSRVGDQRTHLEFFVAPKKGLGVAKLAAITENGNKHLDSPPSLFNRSPYLTDTLAIALAILQILSLSRMQSLTAKDD